MQKIPRIIWNWLIPRGGAKEGTRKCTLSNFEDNRGDSEIAGSVTVKEAGISSLTASCQYWTGNPTK